MEGQILWIFVSLLWFLVLLCSFVGFCGPQNLNLVTRLSFLPAFVPTTLVFIGRHSLCPLGPPASVTLTGKPPASVFYSNLLFFLILFHSNLVKLFVFSN